MQSLNKINNTLGDSLLHDGQRLSELNEFCLKCFSIQSQIFWETHSKACYIKEALVIPYRGKKKRGKVTKFRACWPNFPRFKISPVFILT